MSDFLKSPHHLLHTRWHGLDDPEGYDSIEFDITVEVDPGDDAFYYYAAEAYFPKLWHEDGNFFGIAYGGLQTNGYHGVDDELVGKMAIFSIWGGVEIIPEKNGWGLEVDELGSPQSVRINFPWKEGVTYRFKFTLESEDSDNRLWSASLTDIKQGNVTRIGQIFVPTSYGKLRHPETFHERYERHAETADDVEPSRVTFSNVSANDGQFPATSWENTSVFSKLFNRDLFWHEPCDGGIRTGAGLLRPKAS